MNKALHRAQHGYRHGGLRPLRRAGGAVGAGTTAAVAVARRAPVGGTFPLPSPLLLILGQLFAIKIISGLEEFWKSVLGET